MRVNPAERILRKKDKDYAQKRIERITRIMAIVLAFISTFVFFFKILFF
jgi:hypothetical protein